MTGTTDMYRDGTYLSLHPDWHDGDGAWKAGQIADLLARNGLSPRSICDVGCGTGRVLGELAARFPDAGRLVGVDRSPDALELARKRVTDQIELVEPESWDPAEFYDLLVMVDVFEHVADYLGLLRSVRRRARRFVFHIPLEMTVQNVARASSIMRSRHRLGHLHYYSRETALATLRDAGYQVLDEAYTAGGLVLAGGGRRRRLARLPRALAYRFDPHLAARWLGGYSLLVLCEGDPPARPVPAG